MDTTFSPLDNELGLWGHQQLTPWMEECVVHLGAQMPFGEAVGEMVFHHQVTLSKERVRQHTEQAGDTYVQLQESPAAQQIFTPAKATERQMMSVDACKVLTTTGEWRDVKTATFAEVNAAGKTRQASYFSRRSEYHRYMEQAQVEVWRRQIQRSRAVCAVADGADWIPPVIRAFRPDALMILDFYHAAEHLATAGRAVFGDGTLEFHAWFEPHRRQLQVGDPDHALAELARLASAHPQHAVVINATQGYFTKRRDAINYAAFKQAGWPIGSGAGEAAHKVVIQSRMKRAGMRWSEDSIDRMAALRNLHCNQRWQSDWPLIVAAHQRRPAPTPSAPSTTKPSLLPPGFSLRPAISWRNQPLGKARFVASATPVEKG